MNIKNIGQDNTLDIAGDVVGTASVIVEGNNNTLRIGAKTRLHQVQLRIKANNCLIDIGANCVISGEIICVESHTRAVIGAQTTMTNVKITMHESGEIRIGSDCMFAGAVRMDTSDMHSVIDITTGLRINPPGDIHIGDHVWLGYGVYVLKGIKIGSHSVIGAHAVVSRDIPDHSLAVGVPAKVIREGVSWSRKRLPVGQPQPQITQVKFSQPVLNRVLTSISEACDIVREYRLKQPENPNNTIPKIPRCIFQFHPNPTEKIKILLEHNRNLCQKQGVEYVLFNTEDARLFLRNHFPPEVLATFDKATLPAMGFVAQ